MTRILQRQGDRTTCRAENDPAGCWCLPEAIDMAARRIEHLDPNDSPLIREVLLNFWKVHILHHAAEGTVYGQWMIEELRRHGYSISPGTLYPLLRRMESHGWLAAARKNQPNNHSRREYTLTKLGAAALGVIREQLKELCNEVLEEKAGRGRKHLSRAAHT